MLKSKKSKFIISAAFLFLFVLAFIFKYQKDFIKRVEKDYFPQEDTSGWDKLSIPQRQPPFFTLSTVKARKFGILPDEKFILETKEAIDKNFIENNLESSAPLVVSPAGANTYEIRPVGKIGLDQIVNIKLNVENEQIGGISFDRDYSWAFQTQGKFRVVSSIPGDEKTNVPVNTGIELVFSQDDYQDPEKFLEILPSVEFRTERHGETLSIVPLDPLEEKTVYTVTLKKGLNLKSRNDPIDSDYQFSFQTEEKKDEKKPYFGINKKFHQVTPEEKFQAKLYTANWNENNKIKVDIYRFYTGEEFIASRDKIDEIETSWKKYPSDNEAVDVDKLDKIMTVDLDVRKDENINYIEFPDSLSPGYYLAEMTISGSQDAGIDQIWIQSTPLLGYLSVGKEQTLLWVNRLNSGSVQGAQIDLVGTGELARTYDNGLAVFNTPSRLVGEKRKYLKVSSADDELYLKVDDLGYRSGPGEPTSDDYWSYFYHERKIYKPSDRINFYGMVKNRSSDSPPANITVEFYQGYYYSHQYYGQDRNYQTDKKEPMFTKTILPSQDGSFTGFFEFEDLPSSSYHIRLLVNDLTLTNNSFTIGDYVKPEIKIEVVGDKKAVFADQKLNFTATAKFFDDTPVADTPLSVHQSVGGKSEEIKTDNYGQITYQYQPKYDPGYRYYPRYQYITVKPAISQEANVEGHAAVRVFGSRLTISSQSEQVGSKGIFTADVNHVDLSKINSEKGTSYLGSPAVGEEVKLNLTKKWYEKIEKGTYYDYVEKVTHKSYTYKQHEETVDTKALKTNADGQISYQFEMEEDKSYILEAVVNDENNRPDETREYYYSSTYRDDQPVRAQPLLTTGKKETTYSLGEEVDVSVSLGEDAYPDNDQNKFLFITAKDGRQDTVISNSPHYKFNFSEKHIPNVTLGGVIFTGRYYLTVSQYTPYAWYPYYQNYFSGTTISYKKEDSKIDLNIDTTQSSNEPGGKAKIIVKAQKDGRNLANTTVNLVLVDQALSAIGFVNQPSILSNLYKYISANIYYTYTTHEPVFPDHQEPQAEKGGGGGARELFKDTAFFGTLKTDENGQAEFSFDLPDNITTWLIYAQAVDSQINAGWEESQLTVTKDFFVTSQFPYKYLTLEKPVLTGGSYGRVLEKENTVNFQSAFYKGGNQLYESSKTASGFKNVHFNFPQLEAGQYSVLLSGRVDNKEDAIKLPFQVINSRFSMETYTSSSLNKDDTLTSAGVDAVLDTKPVTMIISDSGKGIYYRLLKNYCYTSSNRLEKQLAGLTASEILEDSFGQKCDKTYQDINLFQTSDGGLSQVNWGGSNLETTVWAVNLDPDPFDKEALINYLQNELDNPNANTRDKILAAWGLSKLGQPQIVKLNLLKEKVKGFDEKVILGLALSSVGDIEQGRDIFYDILADYAYQSQPYIKIVSPGEEEETKNIAGTSWTLLLGNLVDKTYTIGMGKYITDFRSRADNLVIDLSEIAYIKEEIDSLPDEDTQVYFKTSDIDETADLVKGRNVVYEINPEDINDFYLEVLKGKAEAYLTYSIGRDAQSQIAKDNKLKISRTINKVKGTGSEIKAGDILEVRIDFDVDHNSSPPGRYIITDYIPSGLKYISKPYLFGLDAEGRVNHQDQIAAYSFCNNYWWRVWGKKYFVYYVRAGSVGGYIAEPAVIQSQKELKLFNSTNEEEIKINSWNE